MIELIDTTESSPNHDNIIVQLHEDVLQAKDAVVDLYVRQTDGSSVPECWVWYKNSGDEAIPAR